MRVKRILAMTLSMLFIIALLPVTAQALTNPISIRATAYIGQEVQPGDIEFDVTYSGSGNGSVITHSGDSLPSGLVLDSSSSGPSTAYQIIGTTQPGVAPGTRIITYTHDGCTDFGGNCTVTITIDVEKGPQTIDTISNYNVKMGDANFTVVPQSRNGNGDVIAAGSTDAPTHTFSAGTNPSVATINATTGEVTIVGPGTTTITVSSAATNSYVAATDITFDIVVGRADPTISANNDAAVMGTAKTVTATLADAYLTGADSITFTATSGSVSVPATATANGSVSFNLTAADINTLGIGPHTFTISQTSTGGNAATNNNTVADAQFTLTVNAAPGPGPAPGPSDTTPPTILSVKATPYGKTSATLETVATDASTPLRYQWQVEGSWIDIPGATTATFDYTGLTEGKSYTVRVRVTDAAGNTATSHSVTFTAGAMPITGLPDSYSLIVGQSVSFTPAPTGGAWQYDGDLLSMKQDGGTVTFTALKVGTATVTYTVNGVTHTITITINAATIPQTGDMNDPLPFALLGLASLAGIGAMLLYRKKRRA
ncbi:LPXTG cell wall anchor domain-containing protein [Christensenellaceae bacterium OttesenSCG-928-L17]|nr:LPXTG cell wall anchor domain-containing protein [Christensenellaceae bacterium OttesenSCG-928-L17]